MRKHISITSSLILLLVWAGMAAGQNLSLQDVAPDRLPLDDARWTALQDAVKSRDYARAETLLVSEIVRHPQSPELLTGLGRIFFLDGKYLNCAIAMKKAEVLSALGDHDRFTLALSYIIVNHRDWARPELEKLARMNPRDPLYRYWLGRLDYDARNWKAATENLRKALDLDPTFMKAYDNLGLTYEALGQYDDAISIYRQATNLNRQHKPPSPWPPLNLGALLVKLGQYQEARTCLQESLQYDTHFPKAHYQMGLLLEKEKKDEEAIRELNLAAQYDPLYADPHYNLARIYERLSDKPKTEVQRKTFEKLKLKSVSPLEGP